jgi:hypothetical protein
MVASLSEAAASAHHHHPGPPPRHPLTSAAKLHYTTIETPTKQQGLQGGAFKKITTREPPPLTPTEFGFHQKMPWLRGVGEAGFHNEAFKKE